MLQAGGPRARHETGPDIYWPTLSSTPPLYIECRLNGPNHYARWRATCFKRIGCLQVPAPYFR